MPKKTQQTPPARAGNYKLTRLNAIKHGATSETPVIPGENRAEFDALLADLVRYYQPVGPTETYLVDRIAEIMWRSYRRQRAGRTCASRTRTRNGA
jgi:hypothetical protein